MENYCFVSWDITEQCNFSCIYCCNSKKGSLKDRIHLLRNKLKQLIQKGDQNKYLLWNEIDTVLKKFSETRKRITFGFTGGEPFLYPHFIDICKRIVSVEGYKIALDTNLSTDIDEFVAFIPPEKVEYIYSSLHILEREKSESRMNRFINNFLALQKRGYPISANYVLYPPLIYRFQTDYDCFFKKGICLLPKPFKGEYNGKKYPEAYSENEIQLLQKYNPNYKQKIPNNYYGRRCNAGKTLIRIDVNGNIFRCVGDNTKLGNVYTGFSLYEKAMPCKVKRCPCFDPDRLFGN